ncbi:hypothetical protein Ddye_021772 [Dipteronia dyeriana]|uniref:Uncharacterized protein n=1 Tax=Dipteronia dyeriana TaxID=168575 RepID=A0AAD9WY18_9ROSI|nr:hypothetical protein Ddye_021772 [Dipteronia dyeriana]
MVYEFRVLKVMAKVLDATSRSDLDDGFRSAHSPSKKYHMITTKNAESMNSYLPTIWKLSITSIEEFIKEVLQRWFHDHQIIEEKHPHS